MDDFSNPQIADEFDRWCRKIPKDPYKGEVSLGIIDVLRAHFLIADFFDGEGEGMSAAGPMDLSGLHSTMYRQFGEFERKYRFEICATLFCGLCKNHCFHDANKNTGLLSLLYHLELLGFWPTVSQLEMENLAVDVADSQLPGYTRYKDIAKRSRFDPNVAFLSDYLSRNTRPIDQDHHVITYRKLEKILNRFGFKMENPYSNTIEIVKYEERSVFLGFGRRLERVRFGTIRYPGASAQVSKGDIKKVRKMTNLDYKDGGVDSAAFYGKRDPLSSLITSYQEPLRRLANR